MSKKIYKFIGPEIIDIAFAKVGHVGLKCSLPKDYNDPYELFLTIDFNIDPEVLAFYKEIIGNIEQCPTTCFSNVPISTPMWAHYAHTLKGFVLEFDEEQISTHIESAAFGDIDYRDTASESITEYLQYAHLTKKPRHTFLLNKFVRSSAYFSKHSSWSYENERRLIVSKNDVETINDNMILQVPTDCITAIISGPRAEEKYLKKCESLCNSLSIEHFQMKIGRSYKDPYFLSGDGSPYIFDGNYISQIDIFCQSCNEPISPNDETNECPWCRIDELHQIDAAMDNPMRMLDTHGLLGDYLEGCEKIWRGDS